MKILHIILTLDPEYGGPVAGLAASSSVFEELGVSRTIVSLDLAGEPWTKRSKLGAVIALGKYSRRSKKRLWWVPWVRYGYSRQFSKWLRRNVEQFDVVIINGVWNYTSFASRVVFRNIEVPYFVFTHGMLDPWFLHAYPLKSLVKKLSWLFVEGPLLRKATEVLFTSEDERILAKQAFKPFVCRDRVVSYGVAPIGFISKEQRNEFRDFLPSLGARPFFLFLSRIHPKKGCDLLIDAFSSLAEDYRHIDLVVAGPDELGLTARLRSLAERKGVGSRIHWPGMLQGNLKWGAFAACEAFLLPSHSENFGIVVAEALACSKPVLISNKVNIWREIDKEGAGIVFDDTVEGCAAALRSFLIMPADRHTEMAKNALRTFHRYFEVRGAVMSLMSAFEETGVRTNRA